MADFNYTGGVRFAPDKVVDVTADKDGNPTKACNPITGVCLEGGGGDFKKATLSITNNSNENIVALVSHIVEAGGYVYTAAVHHASKNTETEIEIIIPIEGVCGGGICQVSFGVFSQDMSDFDIQTTGDIEYEDGEMFITGDCSITIA